MEFPATSEGLFACLGPRAPATPLVISVPHAGRDYPAMLIEMSLLPEDVLAALEDRFADHLVVGTLDLGATVLLARRARAWIDLNRDERELDPAMVVPPPRADRLIASAKVRAGLGLIPRRIAGYGEIMARRLRGAEVEARLASDHRPWHAAIQAALAAAHARFGVALLLDLHSMPPIPPVGRERAPQIVIGDRHGRSSASRFVERVRSLAAAENLVVSRNSPYAGGHTLDRHGRPADGIHAMQIEIDRTLYLASDLRALGPGLTRTTEFVRRLARGLLAELGHPAAVLNALAAE